MGNDYPNGPTPVYPANRWTCPECKKQHSKPHHAYPGQVDETKEPQDIGRVVFNRESKDGSLDLSQPIKKRWKDKPGPTFDKKGFVTPLFCPHCGWLDWDRAIILVAEK